MRRKHNPYLAMAALLLLSLIVTWICDGCAIETAAARSEPTPRFAVEYEGNQCSIITDNETGVQYLLYRETTNYGKGIGLCKLEVAP